MDVDTKQKMASNSYYLTSSRKLIVCKADKLYNSVITSTTVSRQTKPGKEKSEIVYMHTNHLYNVLDILNNLR